MVLYAEMHIRKYDQFNNLISNTCNLCLCSWDAASNGPNDGTHGSYDEGANDGTTKKTNEMITHRMCVVTEDISVCGWCDV